VGVCASERERACVYHMCVCVSERERACGCV